MPKLRGQILIFNLVRELAEYRWAEIEGFVRASREGMGAAYEKFCKRYDETTAGWSAEKKNQYVDFIYDDIATLRDASPNIMRHSHCMIIYGTFEHALADICRSVYRDKKIPNAPPEKCYMSDAKGYLLPHIGMRSNPFGTEWEWLDELRIFRNWMAHNGGKAQKDSKSGGNWVRAQTFLNRNRGMIKFDHHREIKVEDALVDRAIKRAKDAIARIEKACDKLYP
jgi:hypothetical protein